MFTHYLLLGGSFLILLVAAEIFTNGIEWLGHRLGVSEGATGSILAAFGTVLPETMIPIIAIISGGEAGEEVGVGAILGAPFMLATVAMFLVGGSVLFFSSRRTNKKSVAVNVRTVQRNVGLFLIGYSIAFIAALVPNELVSIVLGVSLFVLYLGYLYRSLTSGELIEEEGIDDLHVGKVVERVGEPVPGIDTDGHSSDPHFLSIAVQTLLAFSIFVFGANLFVEEITWVSKTVLHIPVAVVALLIAPLATELPETFNSYIWIAREKDTLAVGNITGAMAFQGTVPVTIGILFTSWNLSLDWGTSGFLNGFSVLLALASGLFLYMRSRQSESDSLPARPFLIGGILYLVFIIVLLFYVMAFNLSSAA